jgi:AraC-like DNA-binding protein
LAPDWRTNSPQVLTNHDKGGPRVQSEMASADNAVMEKFLRFLDHEGLCLEAAEDARIIETFGAIVPGGRSPVIALIEALQVLAERCERPDLGVAFARFEDPRSFGALSAAADHFETLREMVEAGLAFMRLENEGFATALEEEDLDEDEAALLFLPIVAGRFGAARFMESLLALWVESVRLHLGQGWTPLRVELGHAPPTDMRPLRRYFGSRPVFGAERYALVLRRRDLDRPVRKADPALRKALEAQLTAQMEALPGGVAARCEESLVRRLGREALSLSAVADDLGLQARTLQRALAAEGQTYGELLDRARARAAVAYLLGNPRPNLVTLASKLGYGEASAASRFLRTRLNTGLRRSA